VGGFAWFEDDSKREDYLLTHGLFKLFEDLVSSCL